MVEVWQKLDTRAITITPEAEVPYELVQETIYPWAYTFEGNAEICTFEFKLTPEQIPGTEWLSERIVNAFAGKLEEEGSRLLELRVYRDTTPTWWTNYRVEVTATASPLAWNAIIIGVLAILFVVAIYFTIKLVDEILFHPPALSEEIKRTWTRGTLISVIGDFEAKLELTPTPPEELEEMSDQELRDYCDQLAEEVVPPEVSWLPLAIVGGLGILGVGAAAALAARAKE